MNFLTNANQLIINRFCVLSQNCRVYLLIAAISLCAISIVTILEYKLFQYRQPTTLSKNLCSTFNIICVYAFTLFSMWIFSKGKHLDNNSCNLFLDSFVVTSLTVCLCVLVKLYIVTPIIAIISLIKQINFTKVLNRNSSIEREELNPEEICKEFTREWLKVKVAEFPNKTRYEIITSNKAEYIQELQNILPKNCNRTRIALYYHSYYCSLWK